ncbi:MAG: hypothetical protein H7A35_01775 [Planctomycetales bacterium]|nr:hypothetical protein [bacterium]UNM08787.1 MAG: hypothetical protein H7A35_01775 [Planctomycetales bacterium]
MLYFLLPNPGLEPAFVISVELQSAIIGAAAGGIFYLTALLLRTWLSNRSDHNAARHDSRVRFLQEQISQLYGPLVGYLHETNTYYEILRAITQRIRAEGAARGDDPHEIEARIERIAARFDRDYFSRINRLINLLLRSKRHLIAEERFPDYLRSFLGHAADWDATRIVVQELGSEYDYAGISGQQWPDGIVQEVERILYELRSDYRRHLKKLGRMN